MNKHLLSICIPTFNRDVYIDQLLESIYSQVSDQLSTYIEICISDNASTDKTTDIIDKWQRTNKIDLIYSKNNKNIGPDLNYLRSVSLATGKYCWLMGSDDMLKPGAISRMIEEIKECHDIYICSAAECDNNMKYKKDLEWFPKGMSDTVFHFQDNAQMKKYFDNAQQLGALFGFLSVLVISREKWNSINYKNKYSNSAWSHTFIVLSILLQTNSTVKYISEPLVLHRGDNDSFLIEGLIKRYLIDFNGFLMLADDFFKNDREIRKSFLKVVTRDRSSRTMLYVALTIEENDLKNVILDKMKKLPYHKLVIISFWIVVNLPFKKYILKCFQKIKHLYKQL